MSRYYMQSRCNCQNIKMSTRRVVASLPRLPFTARTYIYTTTRRETMTTRVLVGCTMLRVFIAREVLLYLPLPCRCFGWHLHLVCLQNVTESPSAFFLSKMVDARKDKRKRGGGLGFCCFTSDEGSPRRNWSSPQPTRMGHSQVYYQSRIVRYLCVLRVDTCAPRG